MIRFAVPRVWSPEKKGFRACGADEVIIHASHVSAGNKEIKPHSELTGPLRKCPLQTSSNNTAWFLSSFPVAYLALESFAF